ncbi:MAG: hypothetical protein WA813_10095, partial [Beijerinckiaceae bacterium]
MARSPGSTIAAPVATELPSGALTALPEKRGSLEISNLTISADPGEQRDIFEEPERKYGHVVCDHRQSH